MSFNSPDGNLEEIFISDYSVIDEFGTVGTLWSWGANIDGRLGDNTTVHRSSPVQTTTDNSNWKSVCCGDKHTVAIKTDGTLWGWGNNGSGQLGDDTNIDTSNPVQTIAGGTNWKQAECGDRYTAAIKTDGTLWLWGYNEDGQLSDGTVITKSSPVQTICEGTNWGSVSSGKSHVVAIKTDGTLWAWGWNEYGQLGDNTITHRSSPVQTIAGGTNWKCVNTSWAHTAAIKTDGTLWLWGWNEYGQLGDDTVIYKSSPVPIAGGGTNWKLVNGGVYHTAAIKTDGTLWLWGFGEDGQLGDNTTATKSSPVQTIAGGTNWKQVSCGTCTAAIKTDGTLWTWGWNEGESSGGGQLGDNTINDRSSPVQTIAGGTNWKLVDCGSYHTAAITYDIAPQRPELEYLGVTSGTTGTSLDLTVLNLQPGDLVVGWSTTHANATGSRPTTSNGWGDILSEIWDTYVNSYSIYKIMGTEPDTSVTLKSNSTYGVMMACAFRGISPINPLIKDDGTPGSYTPEPATINYNGISICILDQAGNDSVEGTIPVDWTEIDYIGTIAGGYDGATYAAYRIIAAGTWTPSAFGARDDPAPYVVVQHIVFTR